MKSTLAYDPASDEWTVIKPKPSKRGRLSSAVVNGSIYVFGGERPKWTFNNNEKYDTTTNKWTTEKKSMSIAASQCLAAVSFDNNKIYVSGDGGGPQPGEPVSNTKTSSPSEAPYTAAARPDGPAPMITRSLTRVWSTGSLNPRQSAICWLLGLRRTNLP